MKRLLSVLALLSLSAGATAFEVKGYSPGTDITQADLTGCEKVDNADSGIPGYRCDTTLGGEKAVLRLAVFENKITAVIFNVDNAYMQPTRDALTEKYGRPVQNNRFIEDYTWRQGKILMSIKEQRLKRGYSLLVVDFALFENARKSAANKAKGDI